MAAKKKKKTVDRWKTKKWYSIVAPKCFDEKVLGQTVASDPAQITGRIVKATLKDITGNMPHQSMGLRFKVVDVKAESAHTQIIGHEIQRGYIMRQLKRMRSIITAIFPVKTKDGYTVMLTVIAFGRGKMTVNQEAAIRKIIVDSVTEKAAKTNFEKLFQEMVFGKVSSDIFKDVRKIYPVNRLEVRKSRVISESKNRVEEAPLGAEKRVARKTPKKEEAPLKLVKKEEEPLKAEKEEKPAKKAEPKKEKAEKEEKPKKEVKEEKPEKEVKPPAKKAAKKEAKKE